MANGYDDERLVDWDPCNLISTLSHGSSSGLLDLYGLKNINSRLIPLLTGIEQLGEASVQTVLSTVFLYNNLINVQTCTQRNAAGVPRPVMCSIRSKYLTEGSRKSNIVWPYLLVCISYCIGFIILSNYS